MSHFALFFLAGIAAGALASHFLPPRISRLEQRLRALEGRLRADTAAELAKLEAEIHALESVASALPRDVAEHVAELRKMLDSLKRAI